MARMTAIDDEVTDYFKEFGWAGFIRCALRLKQGPTFEPHATLALAASCPSWPRCKPPTLAPSCRFRAATLLEVVSDRLAGDEAMLLDVPVPQDVAAAITLSWRPACC